MCDNEDSAAVEPDKENEKKENKQKILNHNCILRGERRARVFVFAFACSIFTTYFTVLLFFKFKSDEGITALYKVPESWTVQITRFICASIFHYFAMNDINFTSISLKYIAMHKHHFKFNRTLPVSFAILKIGTCVLVEIINVLILISLRSHKDCVENLLALTAILNFDNMFYRVLTDADQMVISEGK